MLGFVYQSDGVEERESQSNKSEAMNIKLDLEVASWRSIWLLMPVGKDEILNLHILHREREDSSTLLLPSSTPILLCLPICPCSQVRPCPTREADEFVFGPQLFGPSLNLVIRDNTPATESYQSYRWKKGFALSAHCGKLGGTRACG